MIRVYPATTAATKYPAAATKKAWLQPVSQRVPQPVLQRCSRNVHGMTLIQNLIHDFNVLDASTAGRRLARRLARLHPLLADITCPSDAITVLRTVEPDEHRDVLVREVGLVGLA